MARKRRINLREYQISVMARLQAQTSASIASKLGILVGGQQWLVDLKDVSEVVPVTTIAHVPHTRSWYSGVANIRGNLFSIVDFSSFSGGEPVPMGMYSRLLLVSQKFGMNSGLLVNRMLGLRNPEHFEQVPLSSGNPSWVTAEWRDKEGTVWKELDMRELVQNPDFLQVGR